MTEDAAVTVEHRPQPWLSQLLRDYGLTAAVAVAIFLVGYDSGGFAEPSRDAIAIGLWWTVIVAVALGVWPLARLNRETFVTGALIAAFGALTLLSTTWASSAQAAYAEFTRVALYLGVFAVAAVGGTRDNAGRWCDGLALGITAVGVLGLLSRLFPDLVSQREQFQILPVLKTRLGYPLGYWNGLAIFVGIGIPLLLRAGVAGKTALTRGLAVAPIPALAATIYFASSRGGVATAVVGVLCFLAFSSRRWAAAGAALIAGAGCAIAVLVLHGRDELLNGPLQSAAAESQGRSAALILVGICILTGLVYAACSSLLSGRRTPSPVVGWGLVATGMVIVIVGIAASHPVRRFEDFKRIPTSEGSISSHLLSSSGSGRWQFWGAALREWESKPLLGTGAGSYEEWWAEHGKLRLFVQDAHSLYIEALGELGIVGFLLIVAAFVTGIAAAATRLARARSPERETLAALTAAFIAYAFAAGIDWMWELTVVSIVGFTCLGLMTGPATAMAGPRLVETPEAPPRWRGFGTVVAALVACWLLICAIAIPLLSGARLRQSQDAANKGDIPAALKDALDSRSIQPWADSPYLQLALLEEQAGDLNRAHSWIRQAIDRDHNDWQLWLVAARTRRRRAAWRRRSGSIHAPGSSSDRGKDVV